MRTALMAAAMACTAVFGMPALAQEPVWDANKVQLEQQTLGQGVYAMVATQAAELQPKGVALATTAGIVVGTRSTLVIDTMLNQRLATQVLAEATRLGKGAPAYALNTSYHGDHSYGNMYFPASTVIVQHEETRNHVRRHFADDVKFMTGAFGQGRGIEQIEARTGDLLVPRGGLIKLDLGDKIVEVRDFGFAQTGGDLFVWLPQDKVLFAGNPIVAERPALPWLLDGRLQDTLETLTKVRAFLPADAVIVPGHGRPMPKAGLDWHIGYLTALRDETRAAIAKGATLEQAVRMVNVPDYQGYTIYDWVHKAINVPKAYAELKP